MSAESSTPIFVGHYQDGRVTEIFHQSGEAHDVTFKLSDAEGHTFASPYTYGSLVEAQLAAGEWWDVWEANAPEMAEVN